MRTRQATTAGARPAAPTTITGRDASASAAATSARPAGSGAGGRGARSRGNRASAGGSISISRGSITYAGPRGSVWATWNARRMIRPSSRPRGTSITHRAYARIAAAWSGCSCGHMIAASRWPGTAGSVLYGERPAMITTGVWLRCALCSAPPTLSVPASTWTWIACGPPPTA